MAQIKKLAEALAKVEAGAEPPWTCSIPAAGRKYFGLGKWASYQVAYEVGTTTQKVRASEEPGASNKGRLIPYVQVGRLKKALPRKIEQKLASSGD